MISHLRLIIWDWPLHLGFVSAFLWQRAIHRLLGIQCSNRTKISAGFCGHLTEPLLRPAPWQRETLQQAWSFTAMTPACQHRGMGEDKMDQVGQVLVKTDFPVYACSREKKLFILSQEKTNSLLNQKILCPDVFKFQQNFHLVSGFFSTSLQKQARLQNAT